MTKISDWKISSIYEAGYMDDLYNNFNKLTGWNIEFEIDQAYGTDCYGLYRCRKERFEESYQAVLVKIDEINKGIKKYDNLQNMYEDEVIIYLIGQDQLPRNVDILFEVSY